MKGQLEGKHVWCLLDSGAAVSVVRYSALLDSVKGNIRGSNALVVGANGTPLDVMTPVHCSASSVDTCALFSILGIGVSILGKYMYVTNAHHIVYHRIFNIYGTYRVCFWHVCKLFGLVVLERNYNFLHARYGHHKVSCAHTTLKSLLTLLATMQCPVAWVEKQ